MAVRFVTQYDARIGDVRRFWLVDVVHRNGHGVRERVRRVAPVTSERAAREWEQRLRRELSTAKADTPMSLTTFIDERFWPVYPLASANRTSTIREKDVHLRCHILPLLGEVPLEALDEARIDAFSATLNTRGLAPKTVSNVLMTLGTALRTAVRWGLITAAPLIRRPRTSARPVAVYTQSESARILAASAGGGAYLALLLALHAGLRAGEILALRWEEVDANRACVVVQRSRTRGVEGPTKSGRHRVVPVTQELAQALAAVSLRSGRVLTRPDGSPLSLHDLHRFLDDACRDAQVRRQRFHDLRHTYASQLASAGVPLRYVQEWLGHADLRPLLRYVHVTAAMGPPLSLALGEALAAASPPQLGERTTATRAAAF